MVKRLKANGAQEVIVLHVQDERAMKQRSPGQPAEFNRHDAERLEALCKTLRIYGPSAMPMIRHGIPFREAITVANEIEASPIVLGSQGRSAVREMLAGSTFENVVRPCRQPVLVIRPPRR